MTRAALQAKMGLEKQAHPERFCPMKGCLWKRPNGTHCPRHAPRKQAAGMNCTEAVILAEPIGTHVDLSADSPAWHAEAFMEGIIMCFRYRPRVRIQALYFNGLKQFDHRIVPRTQEGR